MNNLKILSASFVLVFCLACGDDDDPEAKTTMLTLNNHNDACTDDGAGLAPVLPGEAGHYAAVVFTPPKYPATVSEVRYKAGDAGVAECDGGLAHEVQFYVLSNGSPTASPSMDGTAVLTMTTPASDMKERDVVLTPSSTIVLEEGQSLAVAVQLVANDSENPTAAMCIDACRVDSPVSGVDFWSNAAGEPFDWKDLVADFGFPINITTEVDVIVPE